MAIYYLSIYGRDSNDGLTTDSAWRTFGKALGASGLSSGDTLYVGAGVYREIVTVNMVSATSETSIIGDIHGEKFGYGGEIQWTGYLTNDDTLPSATANLNLNGRDFLTFRNIVFISSFLLSSANGSPIDATTTTSTNIKFLSCSFLMNSGNTPLISLTVGFGVSANWLIDSCLFLSTASAGTRSAILITLTTGTGDDYNSNIIIQNCSILCGGAGGGILITSSGTSNQEGGGVNILNNFIFGNSAIQVTTTRVGGATFLYPIIFRNSIVIAGSSCVSAGELGALIENYNVFVLAGTVRSNVAIGANTIADASVAPLIDIGQSFKYLGTLSPFGMPLKNSPLLCYGDRTIAPIVDALGNSRPTMSLVHDGVATSASNHVLSDTSKNFGSSNNLNGYTIKIVDGRGMGQTKTIHGNSNIVISGDGLWITQPDSTSKYVIYQGPNSTTALCSSGSISTLEDNLAKWGTNFWKGYKLSITSGIASGETFIVSGNSSTVLMGYSNFNTIPSSGDAYSLSWGSGTSNSGIDYIHCAVGCYERSDIGVKNTGVVLSGGNSLQLFGPGQQKFKMAVSGNTTINVWARYQDGYSGILPQMIIQGGSGLNIADATGQMLGNSGIWEQLGLNFNASRPGVINVILKSNTTGIGSAYFDSFSIT